MFRNLCGGVPGSSPLLGIGPVAQLTQMTSQAVHPTPGVVPTQVAVVVAAELGVLLGLAACLRLDSLASLLITPVLRGFETDAALTIVVSQLPEQLGASVRGSALPKVARNWLGTAKPWNSASAAFDLVALALLWGASGRVRRLVGRWRPDAGARMVERLVSLGLLALAMGVAAVWQVQRVGVSPVGALPMIALSLAWPPRDAALWWQLLPSAAPISLVAFV